MKLRRPSPALLIACLALFISLGGVSYGVATGFIDSRELRNNTIRTQDLRNNDIRGRDIRNSTIKGRDVAFDTLTGLDVNESRLDKVADADALDGLDSGAFLRPDATGFVNLPLATGWAAVPTEQTPQVDLDPLGYVHLRGVAIGASARVAILPSGARPPGDSYFVVSDTATGSHNVTVQPDGDVQVAGSGTKTVSLDGITFKAGG